MPADMIGLYGNRAGSRNEECQICSLWKEDVILVQHIRVDLSKEFSFSVLE